MNKLSLPASLVDSALEGTIVASFSRIGFTVRDKLYDLSPVDADLTGRVAIVTGGTSGIGRATVAGLMATGAKVYLTSRSEERADEAAKELNESGSPGTAVGRSLDTGDFESIRAFADQMASDVAEIDMLINNAGALTDEYRTGEQGIELTLSSHLLGPYLLTNLLRPHLTSGARVLFMSSGGMYTQGLDLDKIEMSETDYRGAVAYARAKRGQVEMVTYLGPQWAPEVVMHAMHPGWVDTAGVDAGIPLFGKIMGPILRTAEQGADTMVWLAATGGGSAAPGQFWHDRRPRRTVYIPGTGTDDANRRRLIDWLDQHAGLST
ncbi:MAG: SDR family NAD(P)-dependent oxidoreductase [Acidimicrobiia bacterium]|nr:SDR family NAD(P)-dependent oxidoreductase [Acidimicrobiia bacterium]MBT8215251.1 SDR family NAD(P)-dependent oxidoreductase [Acidimicrobiia bacterium]NNF08747.1 SDR family NAD(P)-dependent oxidoreductase [Acidimicrobiia bacterium]NNL68357.1 SDR family NAD(P)-dependent oxidoreductase [Acidimicrobiia bacterium]